MITTLHGDSRTILPTLPERSIQCVITSPPYYGLRRYSDDPREIGQEAQPDCLAWARREPPCGACYVCAMRVVFAGLWRVLRDDGTVFLNLGDSYNGGGPHHGEINLGKSGTNKGSAGGTDRRVDSLKPKDLLGIPWRVALALQADGWYLRSDIVWAKPNCMPESVTDRPTRAHEYVFLLAKNARYFYDAAAVAEPAAQPAGVAKLTGQVKRGDLQDLSSSSLGTNQGAITRNKRTVWNISTQSYSGAHYATMPEALIEPCILAGSSAQACEQCGAAWVRVVERTEDIDTSAKGSRFDAGKTGVNGAGRVQEGERYVKRLAGFAPACACPNNTGSAASVVLDPFAGSGTVLRVAARYQRSAIGIELSQEYIESHIEKRTNNLQVEMQL